MNDPIEDAYPLSPMQMGILFQSLLDRNPGLYLEQLHLRVLGELDVERLAEAVRAVIHAHPILRTVFDWKGGDPLQIVVREPLPSVTYHDLSDLSEAEREETLRAFLDEDALLGVDLETGPLIRFTVFRHKKTTFSLLLTYHHILLDAASVPIILSDLASIYESLVAGRSLPRPTSGPYRDYIAWLLFQDTQRALLFWKEYLRGASSGGIVTPDHTLPDRYQHRVESQEFSLSPEATRQLVTVARTRRLTVNSLLLALWGAVLCRNTKVDEVLVGCTIAVRPTREARLASVAGLCINTVPIRVRLPRSATLSAVAHRVQSDLAEIQEFAFVPLSELKKLLRYAGAQDPFQSIFVYASQGLLPIKSQGLSWQLIGGREMTQYDLTVDAMMQRDLRVKVSYPDVLFEPSTVRSLLDDVRLLLTDLMAGNERPLAEGNGDVSMAQHEPSPAVASVGHFSGGSRRKGPNTKIERDVAAAWSAALERKGIGLHDDFFSYDGDSLASMKVTSALLRKGYDVTVADIYRFPTVAALSEALAMNKRIAVEIQPALADSWKVSVEVQQIIRERHGENVEDVFPLSFIQHSVLRVNPQDPRSRLFHEQSLIEYTGELDTTCLERAWNHAIALNPTLRTAYYLSAKESLQIVLKSAPVRLRVHDLSLLDEGARQRAIESYLSDDRSHAFDLERGPPLRLVLFRLSDERCAVLLSFHVVAMDGWCFAFVMKDVVDAYDAFCRGGLLPSPKRRPYKDYVRWVLAQGRREALAYWRSYLKGAGLQAAIDRIGVKKPATFYETRYVTVDVLHQQVDRCRMFARTHGVTLNTLVQAVWGLSLLEVGGVDDVVFGATVSGRPAELAGSDSIVGLLFNDIPIHVARPPADTPFGAFARTLQEEFVRSRRYEFVPGEDIRWALGLVPDRDLFQTLLVFENYPRGQEDQIRQRHQMPLTEGRAWRRDMSEVDLTCYVDILDDHIQIRGCYLEGVVDEREVERIITLFARNLVDGVTQGVI